MTGGEKSQGILAFVKIQRIQYSYVSSIEAPVRNLIYSEEENRERISGKANEVQPLIIRSWSGSARSSSYAPFTRPDFNGIIM